MRKTSYYIINSITIYRLVAVPFLLFVLFAEEANLFKWLLTFSFFTDAIDGYLARRYKVVSIMGAKLDSLGDDFTVVAGTIGLFVLEPEFIKKEYMWLVWLFLFFLLQFILALFRYGKATNFHTWLAKLAAVLQGSFLILSFFIEPLHLLFYITITITALELLEEIILVFLLPEWKANVKGIYWVLKQNRKLY